VTEATVARWTKKAGDAVKRDEILVELETDKVSLEVSAPEDGTLTAIVAEEGATVGPGQLLGSIGAAGAQTDAAPPKAAGKTKPAGAAPAAPATAAAPSGELDVGPKPAMPAPPEITPPPAAPASPAAGAGAIDITVPTMGESVTEGAVGRWSKTPGDAVKKDEVLGRDRNRQGGGRGVVSRGRRAERDSRQRRRHGRPGPGDRPRDARRCSLRRANAGCGRAGEASLDGGEPAARPFGPAHRQRERLDPASVAGTGRDGRLTKGDASPPRAAASPARAEPAVQVAAAPRPEAEREERVRMTRLRQTIARRLKEAQNTAAMLTTFNEVDMTAVMALRNQYKDAFEKSHGVKLGFMSFFVRAAIAALKAVPAVNAEIDGADLVYKNHYDIGVAVGHRQGAGRPRGPRRRRHEPGGDREGDRRARQEGADGQLSIEDMQGGTFTISNGGVYGSLMSTPILNAPQSGILGMHKIQDRPMVVGGKIEIRPMMYLALSYDHRVVDGKEAVTWLVRLKDAIEDPQRLLLDL
jgi:2-oxoglutarate dehydrogenase E2 component (dihydrolipoamide succinyltransferase)